MGDITETFTVQIGSTLSSIESQSTILQNMTSDSGYYKKETDTSIFTINGSVSVDVAFQGALTPNDIIDETWHKISFPVVEALR